MVFRFNIVFPHTICILLFLSSTLWVFRFIVFSHTHSHSSSSWGLPPWSSRGFSSAFFLNRYAAFSQALATLSNHSGTIIRAILSVIQFIRSQANATHFVYVHIHIVARPSTFSLRPRAEHSYSSRSSSTNIYVYPPTLQFFPDTLVFCLTRGVLRIVRHIGYIKVKY